MSSSTDAAAIAELEETLALQKAAFLKNQYPSIEERKANIGKIPSMVLSNRDAIRDAMTKDFGNHPNAASDLIECLGVAGRAAYVLSQLDQWLATDYREMDANLYGEDAKAEVRYQPKGVVGNIVPWNFPLDLSLGPLCEMLAAGNRVIIKPSEFTPATGALLAKMIAASYPKDLVHVVTGGLELSKRFSQLKFNHLLYTGNPAVGRLVMSEAAKNLTPVTLELGGKCPAIMMQSGGISEENVKSVVGTKLLKNGQMCISIDYLLVPASELDAFVSTAKSLFAEGGMLSGHAGSLDNTGIISERHVERLTGMIKEAEAAGAQTVALGGDVADTTKRQLPLTLIIDPPPHLKCMQEEIFGPLLPVVPYTDLDAAIGTINDGERPLGLYVYGEDEKAANEVINNTNSGGAAINCAALQGALPSLPFGGSGMSGMGRHHGVEGFREFSNPRGVFTRSKGKKDHVAAFMPPYKGGLGEGMAEMAFQQAMAGAQ